MIVGAVLLGDKQDNRKLPDFAVEFGLTVQEQNRTKKELSILLTIQHKVNVMRPIHHLHTPRTQVV